MRELIRSHDSSDEYGEEITDAQINRLREIATAERKTGNWETILQERLQAMKQVKWQCTLCGSVWDRADPTQALPPCNHTEQDWENERVKRGHANPEITDEEARRRWTIVKEEGE